MTIAKLIDTLVRVMGYEIRILADDGYWFVDVVEGGADRYQHFSVDLTLALQGAATEMARRGAST